MVKFISLSSGSSGNCYYLESSDGAILIDVGIPTRNINKELKQLGASLDSGHIKGVLITHEHADHIRSVGAVGGGYNIPIYASVPVHNSIATSRFVTEDIGASRRNIQLGEIFDVAGFEIRSFLVPHDSVQNYGYYITRGNFSMTLATDVGHITSDLRKYASMSKYLIIEANYDHEMLMNGNYPSFLKERVASHLGHLCNSDTAKFLSDIYSPLLKHIWLCHLSKDNNHPELCWKTIEVKLYQMGLRVGRSDDIHSSHQSSKDLILDVLPRTKATQIFYLDE